MTFSLIFCLQPQESPCAAVMQDLNPGDTSIPFINITLLCVFFPGTGRRWLFQHLKCLPMAASFMSSHPNAMGSFTLVSNRELNVSEKMTSSSWQQTSFATLGGSSCLPLCDYNCGFTQFLGPETVSLVEHLTTTLQHLGTI